MFGLLKRHKDDLSEYPDTWELREGTRNGQPFIVRKRVGLKGAVGHPVFQFQIGVAVPLAGVNEAGLPDLDELEVLTKVENALSDKLEPHAVLAAVITFPGVREFVLYADRWEPETFEKKVKAIEKTVEGHRLQFMMQHDPKWEAFKGV